jgi:hypothetical protein
MGVVIEICVKGVQLETGGLVLCTVWFILYCIILVARGPTSNFQLQLQ